jgi:hypothetical protein
VERFGRQEARNWIKPITSHNAKVGFNWNVPGKAYTKSTTAQPKDSIYYLAAVKYNWPGKTNYTTDKNTIAMLQEQQRPYREVSNIAVPRLQALAGPKEDYMTIGMMKLKKDYDEAVASMRLLEEQYKKFKDETSDYVNDMPQKIVNTYDQIIKAASELDITDEKKYVVALTNPFSELAQGARIPQNYPVPTVTEFIRESYDADSTAARYFWNPLANLNA